MSDDAVQDEGSTGGVSRRLALKGMGAGAAGAWAVPMMTALPAGAASASGVPTDPTACDGCSPADPCDIQPVCGSVTGVGGTVVCTCAPLVSGGCACTIDGTCSAVCGSDDDCPTGFVCQTSCCPNPVCFELCA